MSWIAPITWTLGQQVTAAQMNAQIRDNMLETAPGKATTPGAHFVATGANAIAQRLCQTATVAASEGGMGTGSYLDAPTVGPSITSTTGVLSISWAQCQMHNDTTDAVTFFAVDISGATSDGAADSRAAIWQDAANRDFRFTTATLHSLAPGSNTFKIKYKVNSNNGTWSKRNLIVMPL